MQILSSLDTTIENIVVTFFAFGAVHIMQIVENINCIRIVLYYIQYFSVYLTSVPLPYQRHIDAIYGHPTAVENA